MFILWHKFKSFPVGMESRRSCFYTSEQSSEFQILNTLPYIQDNLIQDRKITFDQRQYFITKNAAGGKNVKDLHSVMLPNRTMTIKAKVIMAFRTIAKKGDATSYFFRFHNTANLKVEQLSASLLKIVILQVLGHCSKMIWTSWTLKIVEA